MFWTEYRRSDSILNVKLTRDDADIYTFMLQHQVKAML